MTTRAKDHKVELVEEVVRQIEQKLPPKTAGPLTRFVRQYLDGVAPEDLLDVTADNLFGEVVSAWRFANKRAPKQAKIRVFNPRYETDGWQSTHTVVEIVNDDMPFLVDSVAANLNQHNLTVHLLIHPILKIRRDRAGKIIDVLDEDARASDAATESVLHVEVTQQSQEAELEELRASLARVLDDVRSAVDDWQPMLARIDAIIADLDANPPPLPEDEIAEGRAFLRWLRDDHFTFLGYREYRLERKGRKHYLRLDPDTGLGVLRRVLPESMKRSNTPLTPEAVGFAKRKQLLIITKANTRSTVHRPVYMDYIGVRRFGPDGEVIGEARFLGLLTSAAYNRDLSEIPLLRHRVAKVLERSHFPPNSHNRKALVNILHTYPRDELFQISDDELFEFAHGILHLEERQRIRLFIRRDSYARFYSCLIYVPRERYNTALRERIQAILMEALNGTSVEFSAQVSEAVMARLHFIVHTPQGVSPDLDAEEIENRLVQATRLWVDDLRDACVEHWGEAKGAALYHTYEKAFPPNYCEDFSAQSAVTDIARMEEIAAGAGIALNLYNRIDAPEGEIHFKIYNPARPVPLSDILPMLEHMGLRVIEETPYRIEPKGNADGYWIHDFSMRSRRGEEIDVGAVKELFQTAFAKVWFNEVEDDRFNALVLEAGLTWREVAVLRAFCKYLRQIGITFSQAYMEETLARNPALARALVELFLARFDPKAAAGREKRVAAIEARILKGLDAVANLDEDRIIRRFLNLVQAMLRTNYFQTGADGKPKPYLSFKFRSGEIAELPLPRPWVEVFVYSPRMEGVHLRGGRVARGGIRWSDRREDFRTEILGLMKAQMVKNAVIVPVGAKGGFVVKRPPTEGGREALMDEVVACYKTLMRGLLDLTDNLVGGQVAPPAEVVRYDDDDPYLVVAADKGTATFSDIANGIAAEYGFWLGDAFASGGSSGYDHKKMGITARGAWESVKRHFREFGLDIHAADFTCVGIGDMSGDVFGNGMLLSTHIRLIGAFNHLHIFVDPDPDAATSYAERKRLFELPRSSWADYDPKLISKGGGVFDRKAKSVPISPEMKRALQIEDDKLTPNELIRALLRAPVDLLWNGGIGTYVKASDESHAEVGDRTNDAVRIDARELRCRVVGEGGNLGFTQRGRIEYALGGGRINTDAIDNSAGVDCSDHEVNIKILLGRMVADGDMTLKQRDRLLERMTDEVARLVLVDNYQQTQAISIAEAQGAELLADQARFIRGLERAGKLNRAIEFLPDDEEIAERAKAKIGLTRPELAVLLAYSKMTLYDELLHSDLPEDPYLAVDLVRYFPAPLRERYVEAIEGHRLRREIIATAVTNSMVNRVGATFVHRFVDEMGFAPSEIARAYTVTRDAFDLRPLWAAIEALDNRVPSEVQIAMQIEVGKLVGHCTQWFLRNRSHPIDIAETIGDFTPGISALKARLDDVISEGRARALARMVERYTELGVPVDLAREAASTEIMVSALDIVQAARARNLAVEDVGRVYFRLGERLGIDWLRERASGFDAATAWQRQAMTAIIDDLYGQQRLLTTHVIESGAGAGVDGALERWVETHRTAVARNEQLLADLRKAGGVDLAMLTVAAQQIRVLAAS